VRSFRSLISVDGAEAKSWKQERKEIGLFSFESGGVKAEEYASVEFEQTHNSSQPHQPKE
jgi:hypothetical protein